MLESEQIVTRSKANIVLVFVTIGIIAISSVAIGYFYIQNTILENDKAYLQDEISNLENEQTSLQSQVLNLQSQISISYESGYDAGYDYGYIQGVEDGAGRGYNIRDPTYEEALSFIVSDHTEQHQYSANYTCFDFTADFKMSAFNAGYKCGFVYVKFPDASHAIVAFNTTNHGLIYIEPQSDDIVALTVGQPYWDRTKYEPPSYDDTIVRFTIIW